MKSQQESRPPNTSQNAPHPIGALYGDTLFTIDEKHSKIPRISSNPKYRMPFCHQSVFVKTSYLKQHRFDTRFRICADNDFFTKIYREGVRFWRADMIVSVYDAHGLSSKPSWQFYKEEARIIAQASRFHLLPFTLRHLCNCAKYALKRALPRTLSAKIQSIYNAK